MQARYRKLYVFQWHMTHRCNLRCRHCYLDEYAAEPTEIELMSVLGRIIQFLTERHAMAEIDLTGGEPFASPQFFKVLQWLEYEPRIENVKIMTNGTLLNDEILTKLKTYKKVVALQISIDGIEKTHDAIRGKGNFEKAINGIRLLHKHGYFNVVSFTANRLNYKEFGEVAKIVIEAGADRVWTDRVVPLGDADKKKDIIDNLVMTPDEFIEYIDIIRQAREKNDNVRATRSLQYLDIDTPFRHICGAGKAAFTITADCELMPCRRLEENYGSVLEKPISQILSENKNRTEEILRIPDRCKECDKVDICKGGAKCQTCAVYGDYNHPDPNCRFCK